MPYLTARSKPPTPADPLLITAIESITKGMAEAFDKVRARPDAAELIDGFLDGRLSFWVRHDGVLIISSEPG